MSLCNSSLQKIHKQILYLRAKAQNACKCKKVVEKTQQESTTSVTFLTVYFLKIIVITLLYFIKFCKRTCELLAIAPKWQNGGNKVLLYFCSGVNHTYIIFRIQCGKNMWFCKSLKILNIVHRSLQEEVAFFASVVFCTLTGQKVKPVKALYKVCLMHFGSV